MTRWTCILLALLVCGPAQAYEVYLCKKNGKTVYSDSPTRGDCRRVDLQPPEPSPEELERLRLERERREAERQAEEKRRLEERKARAAEAAARAAEREAQASEAEARYQRERLKALEEAGPDGLYYPPYLYPPYIIYDTPRLRPPPGGPSQPPADRRPQDHDFPPARGVQPYPGGRAPILRPKPGGPLSPAPGDRPEPRGHGR